MVEINDAFIYWMLLGVMAGLHLAAFTERDRQNRKIRRLAEAQRCTLLALRDAQVLMLLRHPLPDKQVEFDQKVTELERLFDQ